MVKEKVTNQCCKADDSCEYSHATSKCCKSSHTSDYCSNNTHEQCDHTDKCCCSHKKPCFYIDISTDKLKELIVHKLECTLAKEPHSAGKHEWWSASCQAVKELILSRFIQTQKVQHDANARRLYYLSLEYLPGRFFANNLCNAGLLDTMREALHELGQDFDEICNEEPDPGLGNGGLGRLASCFLDSLATLNYPAIGYGIHYQFGLFKQEIKNNKQVERPDNWLICGDNPWKIARPSNAQRVKFYGNVSWNFNDKGVLRPTWENTTDIVGIPWDIPIVGYSAETINFLRLWEAKATESIDLDDFNRGNYVEAVKQKITSETISKILYPNDTTEQGKELRLMQQYFFVSCSIQDILRRYRNQNKTWKNFTKTVALQLNDTHPTVAIVELMRVLIDDENFAWEDAWDITKSVFAYTNHTLLPEALETWGVGLFKRVLPRHYEIICEINRRFIEEEVAAKWPGDMQKKRDLTIITDGEHGVIRMAHLAVVGSHSINGVARMHSELLKTNLFPNFHELYPDRFNNKTNGITPRRWIKLCNPELSKLICDKIGCCWIKDLYKLKKLEEFADNKAFLKNFREIKLNNKKKLTKFVKDTLNIELDPNSIFDVQIKRLHEYKRQHLNLLHILYLCKQVLKDPEFAKQLHPHTFIFAAKAAPGYVMAKKIIQAINIVANYVNNHPALSNKIKVVFIPNYCVTIAEKIIPAADLSEQISTAGKEASGTGNMKFALNGACTIGTLDGANVEIQEEVGPENIFIFGNTEEEITKLRNEGYNPYNIYAANPDLKITLDWMQSDFFAQENENPVRDIATNLIDQDPFFVLADFEAYARTHAKINEIYQNADMWTKMSLLNVARIGKFSSDRTIHEYAKDIWNLKQIGVGC